MARFGDALEALEDFRARLVNDQVSATVPQAQALAFRPSAGAAASTPLRHVHATGVGVRKDKEKPGADDFVIKVYFFDKENMAAASSVPLLSSKVGGVDVDFEHLPIQVAYAKKRSPRKPGVATRPKGGGAKGPKAQDGPAEHQQHVRPVVGGVEIGPLGGDYVGTLGCFVRRGSDQSGPVFVLSNNHVLANVNRFTLGTQFTQPFSADAGDVIASLSDFEQIHFPSPGSQPRNVIDAAIAGVTDQSQITLGTMLNIDNYVPGILAPRPGMAVIKSGRTTGVTRGTIRAIRVRGVQVNYGSQQNPIIATFDNAITITGDEGSAFSNPGDSGSVILDQESGNAVALLFAGDGATTTACDIAAACSRFNVLPV